MNINDVFQKFSAKISRYMGSPAAFILSVLVIITWAVTGPLFNYSNNWQLVINTGTTIVTFLMIFLVQTTQNRDAKAIHLKLDELIYAIKTARNELVDIEEGTESELNRIENEYKKIRENIQSE
jgi:low affinity Fe/Cu permease